MTVGTMAVRHIEKSGYESVVLATSVGFDPAIGQHKEYPNGQVVAFGVPNPVSDGCNRYSTGKIFVMNEAGATIAQWDLDEPKYFG